MPIFLFIVFWKLSRPSKRKFREKKRKIYIFRSEIWEAERGESNSGFPVCLVIAWNRGVHFFSFSGFSWEREGWPPINFRGGESPFSSLENPAKLFRKLVPSYILFPHECISDKYRIFFPGETEGWKRSLICLNSLFWPVFVRETHMLVGVKKLDTGEQRMSRIKYQLMDGERERAKERERVAAVHIFL